VPALTESPVQALSQKNCYFYSHPLWGSLLVFDLCQFIILAIGKSVSFLVGQLKAFICIIDQLTQVYCRQSD